MMEEIGGLIAENWQPFLSFLITWALPFIVVFGAIYLGYRLRNHKNNLKGQTVNETKVLDWVTCDKCGFIGVRNIKTRELEEVEDNQRNTGQPILTRINSLGDTEPRHEKVPECLVQLQDFAKPPFLPLFYMQLPRQCPQFVKWQKGFSPKEHKEIIDRQLRQQSTTSKKGSQSLGDGIQPIVRSKDDYSDIEVNPFVESIPEYNHYKYNAILEVHNIGKKGNFTANATILEGRQKSKQYSMYWKLPPYSNQDINKNDKKFILVAGISEEDNDKEGIYKNGIVIYGFSGSTLEKYGVSEKKTVEDYYYKKVYPTMYKGKLLPKDTCVIEVIITSDQPLLNEFKQRYAIEIDHEQGDKLLFTPLPESNPDKEGYQH